MLFYLPLEMYHERYTVQLSAPKTGWLESNWIARGIEYRRVDGAVRDVQTIKTGCVVDAIARSRHCFAQISALLKEAELGNLKTGDVIYFDDFWHPGMEALPYAFDQMGIKVKMYAMLHAQSVDEYDFTYPMRDWMRPYEQGNGEVLDGIFVANTLHKELIVRGGIGNRDKVHVVGLPFNSTQVRKQLPTPMPARRNDVVFSSRWDREKNPWFFLSVARTFLNQFPDMGARFVICTSAKELRSNEPGYLPMLRQAMEQYPDSIILKEGLSKEDYYATLTGAKVQMNTANQDWVSWTLLDATVAGCYPLYPYFRSFPETLKQNRAFMYEHLDVDHAVGKLVCILNEEHLWTDEAIEQRSWIYRRFDDCWLREAVIMGLLEEGTDVQLNPYL